MDEKYLDTPAFGACEFSYLVRAEDVPPKGAHLKFALMRAIVKN